MPAPHHSVFYRPDALPAAQPTASKHRRHLTQADVRDGDFRRGADVRESKYSAGGVDVRSLADAANHDWQKAAT